MKFPKWLVVFIALQLAMFSILLFFILRTNRLDYRIVAGAKGDKGDSSQVDYEQLNDYIRSEIAKIPIPSNGKNATSEQIAQAVANHFLKNPIPTPQNGVNGKDGTDGSDGNHGQNGKNIVLRCRDFNSKKSQVQFKYEGDDTWTLLYELPDKCTGVSSGGTQ